MSDLRTSPGGQATQQQRPADGWDEALIRGIVGKHQDAHGGLIAILTDVQKACGYLPKEALRIVAQETGSPLIDIYGVATFYDAFSLEPRGKHLASVCTGTACHVRGAPGVLREFEKELEVEAGQTTDDRMFTLNTVHCLGACALGPVAVVDGEYHRNVGESRVGEIVESYYSDDARPVDDDYMIEVELSCPRCNRSLLNYDHLLDGRPMIHVTAVSGRMHGWFRLSSMYGDPRIETEHEIPEGEVLDFFCPRCHEQITSSRRCPRCEAPMIRMLVRAGGVVRVCSRMGCKEHLLDLSG